MSSIQGEVSRIGCVHDTPCASKKREELMHLASGCLRVPSSSRQEPRGASHGQSSYTITYQNKYLDFSTVPDLTFRFHIVHVLRDRYLWHLQAMNHMFTSNHSMIQCLDLNPTSCCSTPASHSCALNLRPSSGEFARKAHFREVRPTHRRFHNVSLSRILADTRRVDQGCV